MEIGISSPLPSGFGTRPWLIQTHGSRKDGQSVVAMPDRSLHETIIPEMQGKICLGSVYDGTWLMMVDEATNDCSLLSVTSRRRPKIPLPQLPPTTDYKGATCGVVGSPSPPAANFTVVIAGDGESEENFLLCCRSGDEEWTDLTAADGHATFSGTMVSHAGKLYAGNLIMMDDDAGGGGAVRSHFLSTVGKAVAMNGSTARHLLVSSGDLFSVLIKYQGRPYDGSLIRMTVRRLDLSDLVWRRVESIGSDRVFLLSGDYGFSCSAAAAGMQGNCVYLVWSSCDCERLYKFCLDDMTKSFHRILPNPTEPCCRAYWVVPDDIQASEFEGQALMSAPSSNEITSPIDFNNHPEEQSKGISLPPWQDLPLELLELVASNLSLVDRIRFPAVCKSWSKISNPIGQAKVWPWLMHISKQDGECQMFDPLRGEQYTLQVKKFKTESDRHFFRSAKDGWVVASAGLDNNDVFVINPFTQDIVKPPMFEWYYRFHGVTFSSTPASPDSVIFGVCSSPNGKYVSMETWRPEEDLWSQFESEHEERPFPVAYNNPIYFRGEFYCLGRKGNLAIFNPDDNTWRVLDKPEPVHAELQVFDDDHEGATFCYLVELGEGLISVFLRNADEPPRVFKLDEMKMAWIEVEDIGGAALFVDYRASFGLLSPGAGNGNRIYFPRYSEDGKHAAFYDMETKVYHPTFYGVKEPLNCVWVVPNLQ
ncbi:unnamed protein product [Urochloa decumbens]|uniref:F-box domain-containing protein n=1 Tax=Urochloa decumbens TaxID=240449 RepID=A0ABC9BCM5_9POAL